MNVTVALDRSDIELGPGDSATVTVTIGNSSDVIEHYGVSIRGLPEGATAQTTPEESKLRPGETGHVDLTITLDQARPPVAGPMVLGVLVKSPHRTDVMRCEELTLRTQPAPKLSLNVRPEVVTRREPVAEFVVANEGNTVLDIELGGRDPEGAVRLEFRPPRVRLAAREQTRGSVRPQARRPLSGTEVRRQITLTARSSDAEATASLVQVQRPLVPGGMLRLAGAATGVVVMAAAVIAAGMMAFRANGADDSPKPTVSAASSPAPSPSAPSVGSAGPTSSTTSPESTTGGQDAVTPVVLDLSQPPAGLTAVNRILTAGAYPGLVLSAVADPARKGCGAITSVSWLRVAGPTEIRGVVPGAFDEQGAACSDLALLIELNDPAAAVSVKFIGTSAKAPASSATAAAVPLVFSLQATGGQPVVSGELVNGASSELNLTDATGRGIRSLTLTGVPANSGIVAVVISVTITPMP